MLSKCSRLKRRDTKAKIDEESLKLREGTAWLLKHFARERMEYYRDAFARWDQWQADGLLSGLILILDRDLLPKEQATKVHVRLDS